MTKDITIIASTNAGVSILSDQLGYLKKDNPNSFAKELLLASSFNICGWFHFEKKGLYNKHFRNNELMVVSSGVIFDKCTVGESGNNFSGDYYVAGDVIFPHDVIGSLVFAEDTKIVVIRGARDNWWEHNPESKTISCRLREAKLLKLKKQFYSYAVKQKKEDRLADFPTALLEKCNISLISSFIGTSRRLAAIAVNKYKPT